MLFVFLAAAAMTSRRSSIITKRFAEARKFPRAGDDTERPPAPDRFRAAPSQA
jgi:hypothetical protein